MAPAAPEVLQVAEAIHRAFALGDLSLPEAFRPAHLTVTFIDAVFGSGLKPGETSEPAAERYCRRFGRTRGERRNGDWFSPLANAQPTWNDGGLIHRVNRRWP